MKKILAVSLMLAVSMTGAPAYAADEKDQSEEDPQVCRTEKVTGSRVKTRRICMAKSQWEELAAETKQGLDRYASSASGRPPASTNPLGPGS